MFTLPLMYPVPAPDAPASWCTDVDLAQVRSADELPQRFAVGPLDHEAFSADAGGWSARWADDAVLSSLLVEYHRPTRRARVRTQFLGSNPLEATTVASLLDQLLIAAFDPIPSGCDVTLARALHPLALTVPPRFGASALWPPFGPMIVLAVPLHALQVEAFRDWLAARPLPGARDHVQDWVGLSGSSVRYEDDNRPQWFTGIEAARAQISAATGLPAGVESTRLRDGRAGWYIDRPVYLGLMLVPLAGVPALAADLHAAGFLLTVHKASNNSHHGANGLEMESFLLTTDALERAGSFTYDHALRGISEVTYLLSPCGTRVPWSEWLKYALRGGVTSLRAPLPSKLTTPSSSARH